MNPTRRSSGFWLITAVTLAGVLLTLALGRWQLGRASQKQALEASVRASGAMPALGQADFAAARDKRSLIHRPLLLQGRWLDDHTVFLDNRQLDGRTGFFVLTPLRLDASRQVVMVQRGWAPRDFLKREQLPRIETPEQTVRVEGRVAAPPARLFEFQGGDSGAIRQNIDLAGYAAQTGLPLLTDVMVLETSASGQGLLRRWPAFDAGVAKHHGYAAQWFGLSALLIVLYVWFQFIAPRRAR